MKLLALLSMIASAYALGPTVQITPRSWNDAIALAQAAVAKLSPQDRVALGSGLGWMNNACVVCARKLSCVMPTDFFVRPDYL
ncbi:hypothetical protein BC830DRAFT_1108546 [Chytriomyces sp. MP71]|nr:hypothetical protein BC830DRAFT_1108546 [Chytriomyces sp. MP71]